jgi:hypothetical protein
MRLSPNGDQQEGRLKLPMIACLCYNTWVISRQYAVVYELLRGGLAHAIVPERTRNAAPAIGGALHHDTALTSNTRIQIDYSAPVFAYRPDDFVIPALWVNRLKVNGFAIKNNGLRPRSHA